MIESQKHLDVFEQYYLNRNVLRLSKEINISRQSIGNWVKEFGWKKRCEDRDAGIAAQVQAVMTPQYAATKVLLIQTFLNQIQEAIKAGIVPESSRDLVAISRELRALMGDGDKHEVEITGIEYVLKD